MPQTATPVGPCATRTPQNGQIILKHDGPGDYGQFFPFARLYAVPDLLPYIFGWLDPSSRALAAGVCKKWREAMQQGRSARRTLILAELVYVKTTLVWAIQNLNKDDFWQLRGKLCAIAAKEGALETLQWARENGCPWDRAECMSLAQNAKNKTMAAWIETQFD
jgi:hypothetical protein